MQRFLKMLYEYSVLYASLTLLGLICLTWSLFAVPLYFILPGRIGIAVGPARHHGGIPPVQLVIAAHGRLPFGSRRDRLPRGGPPVILAPNHPALIDAPLILSRHPNLVCVMKAELMNNVFLGAGARLARYVGNDSSRQIVKESVAHLHAARVLLLFPEGTRTTRAPINPLVGSVGLIAKQANVAGANAADRDGFALLEQGMALVQASRFAHHLPGSAWGTLRSAVRRRRIHRAARSVLPAALSRARRSPVGLNMPERSNTHLVLIPSYNPGPKVFATVRAALDQWAPVWVVVDGSTDHSEHRLAQMAAADANLRVFGLPKNRGKGAAVLFGLREALHLGLHPRVDHGLRRPASRR